MDAAAEELTTVLDSSYGFSFKVPLQWKRRPTHSPYVKTLFYDEEKPISFNVAVVKTRGSLSVDYYGVPTNLKALVASLDKSTMLGNYPADWGPSIKSFENAELAGQLAKRVVVEYEVEGALSEVAVQYITFRDYGSVTLTLSGLRSVVEEEAVQNVLGEILKSFTFKK